MIPKKKANVNKCKTLNESGDDFQDDMIFREPKRIKLKVEKGFRKSSRTKDTSSACSSISASNGSSNHNDTLPIQLLDIETAACSENEKICISCKAIVSAADFSCHLIDCLKRFKSQDKTSKKIEDKKVLPCPVCSKKLSSSTQRISHMKKCATEYGLSSDKLLIAVRLQERQADERASIGLPLAVRLQERQADERASIGLPLSTAVATKTNEKKRKRENQCSPEMELAYALSLSMVDKQQNDILNEEANLVEIGLPDIIIQKRRERPPIPTCEDMQVRIEKCKRKIKKSKTRVTSILATRTKEERENILSEKLAEILLNEEHEKQPSRIPRHSNSLASFISKNCALWDISNSADRELEDYYVPELSNYIEPKFIEVGGLLKHFSQIPGRHNFTQIGKDLEDDGDNIEEDDPEKTLADLYSTQLALAELLGSQEFIMDYDGLSRSEFSEEKSDNGMWSNEPVAETHSGYTMSKSEIADISDSGMVTPNTETLESEVNSISDPLTQPTTAAVVPESPSRDSVVIKTTGTISYSPAVDKTVNNINSEEGEGKTPQKIEIEQHENLETYEKNDLIKKTKVPKSATENEILSTPNINTHKENDVITERNIEKNDCSNKDASETNITCNKLSLNLQSNFISDWSKLLTNGKYSDITIETAEGKIAAHSLVLNVRCGLLSDEARANESRINWSKIAYETALSFMIYLYTGQCSKNSFNLMELAGKYGCVDLVNFLRNDFSVSKSGKYNKRNENQESEINSNRSQVYYNSMPSSPDIFGDSCIDDEIEHDFATATVIEKDLHVPATADQSVPKVTTDEQSHKGGTDDEEEITFISFHKNTSLLSNQSDNSQGENRCARRKLYEGSPRKSICRSLSPPKPQCSTLVDLTSNSSDSNCSDCHEVTDWHNQSLTDQLSKSVPIDGQNSRKKWDIGNTSTATDVGCTDTAPTVINSSVLGRSLAENEIHTMTENLPDVEISYEQSDVITMKNNINFESNYVNDVWDDFDDGGVCEMQEIITPPEAACGYSSPAKLNASLNSSNNGAVNDSAAPDKSAATKELNLTTGDIGDATLLQVAMQSEIEMESMAGCSSREPRLQRPAKAFSTPLNLSKKGQNITPMLPYKTMITPELRRELDKYGIRKLSKNKAIKLLAHIYEEMHPLVTDSETSFCDTPIKNRKKKGHQPKPAEETELLNSSQSSVASSSFMSADKEFETSLFGVEEDEAEVLSLTQKQSLEDQIFNYIENDTELYKKILMYEPIWLKELQTSLKNAGIKCSSNKLIDFLDEQCITFRYNQNASSGRRRRGKKKIKEKK